MFSFLKKKKDHKFPVEFTSLVKEGANFVIILSDDTYLNYEILQFCANWDQRFRKFSFFLPAYSCGFFKQIKSFSNAEFKEIGADSRFSDRSIILNLSTDPLLKKKLSVSPASLIIDRANEGNLQFVPGIADARELFDKFCNFFGLIQEKKALNFEFSEKEIKGTGLHFYQNKFLNFLLDTRQIDQNTLKQIIISIKQNFPSNIYLNGQNLKKHEFINLKNMPEMTLLEKYLFARNSDLLISDDLEAVKIFRDLNLKQIYVAEDNYLESVPSVNTMNLHLIRDAIASVLDK